MCFFFFFLPDLSRGETKEKQLEGGIGSPHYRTRRSAAEEGKAHGLRVQCLITGVLSCVWSVRTGRGRLERGVSAICGDAQYVTINYGEKNKKHPKQPPSSSASLSPCLLFLGDGCLDALDDGCTREGPSAGRWARNGGIGGGSSDVATSWHALPPSLTLCNARRSRRTPSFEHRIPFLDSGEKKRSFFFFFRLESALLSVCE